MVAERGYNRAAVAGQEPVSERWRLFDACSNAPTLRIYEWWKGTLSLSLARWASGGCCMVAGVEWIWQQVMTKSKEGSQ